MSTILKLRRGITSAIALFTGSAGEVAVDTTENTLVVQDGATPGGFPLARQDLSNVPNGAVTLAKIDRTGVSGQILASQGPGASPVWTTSGATNKNRLINGLFIIDKRYSGAAATITAGAGPLYTVDRWYASCTGGNITGQQISSVTGGYNFTGGTGNTGTLYGQRIAAANAADLASGNISQSVTLSSSSLTTVTWTVYSANATNNFSAKTVIATGTFTINATPTAYSFTINAGANAANGIAVEFTTGALLAGQTLSYDLAKLEKGSANTIFTDYDADQEAVRCAPYCQNAWASARTYGPANSFYGCDVSWQPMRATPSVVQLLVGSVSNVGTANLVAQGAQGGYYGSQVGGTTGDSYVIGSLWQLTAEL
jgi:hypothetical protein